MRKLEIKNETGRSMIEMLGVLAIIGVLSVGGIAGYSKAMTKYRINKTIEQITLIAGNIRTFYSTQKTYAGLDSTSADGRKIIQKAKLIPDEMWNSGKTAIENAFGGTFTIASFYQTSVSNYKYKEEFYMNINSLPQEVCIELATKDWSSASPYAISIGNIMGSAAYGGRIGHNDCQNGVNNNHPAAANTTVFCDVTIPLEASTEKCHSGDTNTISLLFH